MQISWSLVISTALQRLGLGMYLICFILSLVGYALPLPIVALSTLAILCLAGISSIFHLQTPARFFNAFSNIHSHLTQEALLTPLLGLALLVTGLDGLLYSLGGFGVVMQAISALCALAFLVSTGLAYQLKSRPAWRTGFVLGLFMLTSWAAGSAAAIAVVFLSGQPASAAAVVLCVVGVAACFIAQFAYVARYKTLDSGTAVDVTKGECRPLFMVWLVVGVICFAILLALALILGSSVLALLAAAAAVVGVGAWTAIFFRAALKVRMFPMYAVDLNLDM